MSHVGVEIELDIAFLSQNRNLVQLLPFCKKENLPREVSRTIFSISVGIEITNLNYG